MEAICQISGVGRHRIYPCEPEAPQHAISDFGEIAHENRLAGKKPPIFEIFARNPTQNISLTRKLGSSHCRGSGRCPHNTFPWAALAPPFRHLAEGASRRRSGSPYTLAP